jgi:type I restriction enzyme S subunit
MVGDWIECKLADACNSIDYGLTAPASDVTVGPRFLRITDIVSGSIDWTAVPHVVADDATTKKYRLDDGDIVIARTGASTGVSAFIKEPPSAVFASYLVRLKAKQGFHSRFLAYYLRSEAFWSFIRGVLGDKSAQPNASASTMTQAPLRAPRSIETQRAIAHILGTLDDKIELNRKMNETLEAMAQALFKNWFVDFEPVRDQGMEDRDPGLPKEIADLFPDRFYDSELGQIPEGWSVKTIGDAAERVAMGPFGSSIKVETFVPEGVPIISGQHLHGFMLEDNIFNFITYEHARRLQNANVQRGDVVFTHAGNIGQAAFIPETSRYDRYVISQRQFYMRCDRSQVTPAFIALYFNSPEGRHQLLANTSSSGVPSIARPVTYLRTIQLTIPKRTVLDAFERLVSPLLLQFSLNKDTSCSLAAIRDILLPKLLSGEIRVKDAERFAERAV